MKDRNEKPQTQSFNAGQVLACFCMAGFLVVLALVVTEHAVAFDDAVRGFFYDLRSDRLTSVLKILTNAASKYFVGATCLILLIIPRTRLYFGLPLSAGALGTILLNTLVKHLVHRSRPELILHLVEEGGYSFPSGHSITSMFFYGMALWLIWHNLRRFGTDSSVPSDSSATPLPRWKVPPRYTKKTAIILTVVIFFPMIVVGLSRVYLGVHFPTDVLGAWCLGVFAVCVEAEIILFLERRGKI